MRSVYQRSIGCCGSRAYWARHAEAPATSRNKAYFIWRIVLSNLQDQECQIVMLWRAADPASEGIADLGGHGCNRQIDHTAQQFSQTLFAELFFGHIQGFGDAVGKGHEHVARLQLDLCFLVFSLR